MNGYAHPRNGDGVSILAPRTTRLSGQVVDRRHDVLTIRLDQAALPGFHFDPGTQVAVEWSERRTVMQASATVESAASDPVAVLEVELVGAPSRVERRHDRRFPVALPLSAWSPAQPTRRHSGNTVDLSSNGALVSLPELSPLAATVELQVELPDGAVSASASVRWRTEPGLVGLRFERMSLEHQAQLADYLPR